MNLKRLSPILLSFLILFVFSVISVNAQPTGSDSNPPPTGSDSNIGVNIKLQNPFNCGDVTPCTLFTLLEAIIDGILLPIGGVLAVLAFIYSGFLYVTAQGNEIKLKTAHKALLYTSIGTAVLLGSWVIAKVIENTINQLR